MSLKQYIIEALQQPQADAVVGWGRGMGHKGHMLLAQAVIVQAQELKATPFFFVSETMGKDDPLTPEEKLFIYKKVFPQYAGIFHAGSTLASVLTSVGQQYKNVLLVLGEDQVQPFQWLMKPDKSGNVPYQSYGLESLQIISRQQVNDPAQSEAGPRATPMREILINPNATEEEQFAYWREAMPDALSDAEVLEFMNRAKSRLNVPKKVKEPKQKAVKQIKDKALKESVIDIVRKAKPLLKEASLEKKIQFVKLMKVALKESQQGVAEDKSNDTAISLSKLGKFHPGADTLAQFVPERATAQYALHPDKWESTFYSLTNKDSDKLKYYGPKKISIPPGTLVGDMAIANKFYRAKTTVEKQQYAEAYKASLQPYPVDVSEYRMPELLIPKQGVAEEEVKEVTKQSAIKQYQDIQNYKDKPSPKQDDKEFIKVSINRPKKTNTNESFDYIDEE